MYNLKITNLIEKIIDNKIYLYGFADLKGLLDSKYSYYTSGISILRKLDDKIMDSIKKGPTREYFEHYKEVNKELAGIVNKIEDALKNSDIDCLAIKPTFSDSELDQNYEKTLRTGISHKMVATRAGLGWIGKTDLLVSFKWGPRVRLASILLNLGTEWTTEPVERSECGSCVVCIKSCPGETATGSEWNIHTDRDVYFNAFKCRQTCRAITKKMLNEDLSICGICAAVCPIGKKSSTSDYKL